MTTTDLAPTLHTNSFGIPCTYQSLEQWAAYVLTCTSAGMLTIAWKGLQNGNGGHAHLHPFRDRSEEYDAARKVIWKRAYGLNLHYSRVSYRFVEN